jgi:hypothetical protein
MNRQIVEKGRMKREMEGKEKKARRERKKEND